MAKTRKVRSDKGVMRKLNIAKKSTERAARRMRTVDAELAAITRIVALLDPLPFSLRSRIASYLALRYREEDDQPWMSA
jgi:hypothetical protein